jgi:protein-tyrosine-phosphatase
MPELDRVKEGSGDHLARILFVCTGNICRSPAAQYLLKRRLEHEGLDDWEVESAGTWALEGRPISAHMASLLAQRGIDASAHRSREINERMIEEADLVLVMTRNHAEALGLELPEQADKVYLLSEMASDQRYDIQDPYGGSLSDYRICVEELERLIQDGFDRIRALAESTSPR